MLESEHDCAKSSHGYAGYGAMSAARRDREPLLNVGDQVMHNLIFVTVLRSIG